MDATREIYWNVGHGFSTLGPMYFLALAAFAILAYGIIQRVKVYKTGLSLNRTDEPAARLVDMLKNVLLQTKVLRVTGPGIAHAVFFWGFFLLFIGTGLIVIQADFTHLLFDYVFLKGTFYKLFSIVLDIAGLASIVMLLGLLVRRWIVRPEGLETGTDDYIMHGLLLAILVTGFFIEGARMAVTEMDSSLAYWSPVGLVVAKGITSLGESATLAVHQVLWWFHLVLALAFIALIPFTKFRHILTTSANYFLADRGPTGKLTTLDLEDESNETFGASELTDLTWKDLFDTDACTQCKRCQDRCPAYNTDKPLSPMQLINHLGDLVQTDNNGDLIEVLNRDAIWSCTTCRACQDICPAGIEHVGKIIELRRNLVLMEGEFPGEEVMTAMEQLEVNGNPLGMGYASRGEWAEDLDIPHPSEDADIDVLYFVGCYASFDKRNRAVAKDFVTLCKAAGVKLGILGKDEKCCGEPARKMGNEYLYQTLAMENIEMLNSCGVKKIVTTCPHCFNTLAKDYRDFDFAIEVESHTVFLNNLIKEGKLDIAMASFDCTYHDSCYLGRHNDIYKAPRELIAAAGGNISEMEKNRSEAFCCSAGGGRILAEEKLGERINIKRVKMAAETGAPTLLSNCPFCLTMFEDGVKGAELEESLRPLDIAEVLAKRLTA